MGDIKMGGKKLLLIFGRLRFDMKKAFGIAIHQTGKSGQPTQSIYDSFLQLITYNICLHTEHHDFPQIPSTFLPRLSTIFPKLYKNVSHFNSGYWFIMKSYYSNNKNNWVYAGQTFN